MTNPHITLESVSYVLPNGKTLFSDLNEQFDLRPTGLVGRNGIGKSLLARILAGGLSPSSGRCVRTGRVFYLAQQVSYAADTTIADMVGVRETCDALARIETGSAAPDDFDAVADRWDIRERLQQAMLQHGLGQFDILTPANRLSGGEAMRVALMGAMLAETDFLILDEPTNHLDRAHRLGLITALQHWTRGLLVVSHDRQLLNTLDRTVELSSLGLRSYGGNYAFYAQNKLKERQNALQQLELCKRTRQREEKVMRDQRERREKRQARGNRQGREANQAKILLGRQKERSEKTTSKHLEQHTSLRDHLNERVREAARHVEQNEPIVMQPLPVNQMALRQVAVLERVELPLVPLATRHISLTLTGQQRVGVIGRNGCGKSTLLKVLAGQCFPSGGCCRVITEKVYLDQQLGNLNPTRSILEQLLAANAMATEGDLRMRLAQLGLDAQKIKIPSGLLSGGERIKGALACVLYADPPATLLLLDEPSNHLDLASTEALEALLRGYRGALVVASHDDAFLANIGLTHRLLATEHGWWLAPW